MTNYFENLDGILSVYRINYLNAYGNGRYVIASNILYSKNMAYPPQARLDDMPRFTLRSNSLRTILNTNQKAKNYCDYWDPLLELSMATFRSENQDKYNQL